MAGIPAHTPSSPRLGRLTKNRWTRGDLEMLVLKWQGGETQEFAVGPNDFLQVYVDAVSIDEANILV